MNRMVVIFTVVVAAIIFASGAAFYQYQNRPVQEPIEIAGDGLVRFHSPSMGPVTAPVTIVEFFDPSCEACRAFFPHVKQIMAMEPDNVRLVMRYAAFHEGSDQVVGIIEAARNQQMFEPVLEALLERQPEWAVHGAPDLNRAWSIAAEAGLDVPKAKTDAASAKVAEILKQDAADGASHNVKQTPTFFINGKPLKTFSPQGLLDQIKEEITAAKSAS